MIDRARLIDEQERTAKHMAQIHERIQELDQERGRLAVMLERQSERIELCRELIGELGASQAAPATDRRQEIGI